MVKGVESGVLGAGLTASRVSITEHLGGVPLNNWGLVDIAIEALKAGVVDAGKHREFLELRRTLVKQGLPISPNDYRFWPLVMPKGDCRPWLLRLLKGLDYRQSNETEVVDGSSIINVMPQLTPLYDVYNRFLLSFQGPQANVFEESAAVALRIHRVLKEISVSVEFSPEGQVFNLDDKQVLYQLNMVRDYISKRSGLRCYQTGSGLAANLAEPVILATIDDINVLVRFCGLEPPVLQFDLQRLVCVDGINRQLPLLGFSTITIAQDLATTIAWGFMPEYTKVRYA